MKQAVLLLLLPLMAAATVILTAIELVWAWRSTRRLPVMDDRIHNWICLVVTETLRGLTLPLRVAAFTWVARWAPLPLPRTLGVVACCYVLTDFWYYVFHRVLHATRLGWAVHSVHHSSRAIEVSAAFRLSWPARVVDDLFYLPLVLAGFPPLMVLWCIQINLFTQAWVHTEMIRRLPVLDFWLNTPSNHRVHHHAVEGGRRRNYGAHFMVWDRLFGTYEREGEPRAYGVDFGTPDANPIGIQVEGLRRLFTHTLRVAPARTRPGSSS